MATRSSTEGRTGLTPVRLSDIPIGLRRSRGAVLRRELSEDGKLLERVMVERAIEFPSDALYWVPSAAYDEARRKRTWR